MKIPAPTIQIVTKNSLGTTVPKNIHSKNAAKRGVINPTKDKKVAVYFVSKYPYKL